MISDHRYILGMRVDRTSYSHAADSVIRWSRACESRYVCVASVNNVMESFDSPEFRRITNTADLVTPDGMPVVWALRALGHASASRVYGPDLTPHVLARAEREDIPVGFYGGSTKVLAALLDVVKSRYPSLRVAYSFSPPFRPLTAQEDEDVSSKINASGCRILFIGLNTPKQDYWMEAHRGRVQTVMLGVGAAFDFLAGAKPQAPLWMRRNGLEWAFRLATEPGRLWKRYLKHNPRYVLLILLQILGWRHFPREAC